MRTWTRSFLVLGLLVLPTSVFAQAAITGVVKDASGAVLPGVTVEATSPVLIEKMRSAVTDGTGQYPNRRPSAGHLLRSLFRCRVHHRSSATASS